MFPGPHITAEYPASWNCPPSVPYATTLVELSPVTDRTNSSASPATSGLQPGVADFTFTVTELFLFIFFIRFSTLFASFLFE